MVTAAGAVHHCQLMEPVLSLGNDKKDKKNYYF